MIVFQFKVIAFISSIQEKYKLSVGLNSVFNAFHDSKFSKQSKAKAKAKLKERFEWKWKFLPKYLFIK